MQRKIKTYVNNENVGNVGNVQAFERTLLSPYSLLDKTKTTNIRYFLGLLSQLSRSLHALGYQAAAEALMQVRVDLQDRISLPPEPKPIPIWRPLG